MAAKLITPVFRVSFPSVFTANSFEGGPAKFELTGIWDPSKFSDQDKKRWKAINDRCDEVSLEKFKKTMDKLPGNFKKAIRDGAEKEDLQGFEDGFFFARMSSKMRPGVIDRDRTPLTEEDDAFYPGCYARATITVYGYDNVGKGIALGLQNIQKIKDGDRLDSRTDAGEDFGDDEDIGDEWLEDDPLGDE